MLRGEVDRGRRMVAGVRRAGPFGSNPIELLVGGVLLVVLTLMVAAMPPLHVIVAVLAIMGTAWFFARPELGIPAYFAFRLLADLLWWIPVTVGGLSVLEVLSGGFTALAAVLFFLELRRVERHPVLMPLMVYLLAMALSAVRSFNLRDALEILARNTSPFLLMFLIAALFPKPRHWRRVLYVFTFVGGIPVIVSLYHLATGQMNEYSLDGINRLVGGYPNLHAHGHMMMLLTALYSFWVAYLRPGKWRTVAAGFAAAAFLCLVLSYTRTALLGLGVFALVFPLMLRRYEVLWLVLFGGMVALAFSGTMQERFQDFILIFDTHNTQIDRLQLGSGRLGIWTVSLREFLRQSPVDLLLGVGLDGHWKMVQPYVDQYRVNREGTLNPHNDYLTLLFQLGPLAVVSYIVIQLSVITHALRLVRTTKDRFVRIFACYAAGLASLVFMTNSVSNSFVERVSPAMFLWSMAGLLFAMYQYERREAEAATRTSAQSPLAPAAAPSASD